MGGDGWDAWTLGDKHQPQKDCTMPSVGISN